MRNEFVFRLLAGIAFAPLFAIRMYYQHKVLHEDRRIDLREGPLSLLAGSVAALTMLVFGAEFVFFRGRFAFAYPLRYPAWLRWGGVALLLVGIGLLWWAHHHLDRSFHSFIVTKEDQILVKSGPYRRIRHPIYSAYLLCYLGMGLLSSNLVLTVVPAAAYGILVALRVGPEEKVLQQTFGQEYRDYMARTGRLLPRLGKNAQSAKERSRARADR